MERNLSVRQRQNNSNIVSLDDYMKIALAALDLKLGESGILTLENLQMEHSALKALSTEIRLQLSEAKKKAIGEKPGEKVSKNNSGLVLRARIKSNGKL